MALGHDGEVVQHELRGFCLTSTRLSTNHDGLVPARLLERREGVLGLLEAVGRQTPVGRVVVAADDVVAVDGEPPAWETRDRRRLPLGSLATRVVEWRRDGVGGCAPTPSTPSTRRRLREGVIDAAWSLEGVHRDEDGPGISIYKIHTEAMLDIVEDRRLL